MWYDCIIQRLIVNTRPLLWISVRKGKWVKTWPPRLSVSPGPACLGYQQHYLQLPSRVTYSTSQLYSLWILEVLQGSKIVLRLTFFACDIPSFWNNFSFPSPHLLVRLAHSRLLFKLLLTWTLALLFGHFDYTLTLTPLSHSAKNILVQPIHSDYIQCLNFNIWCLKYF